MYDLVISGGTIIDGSGSPRFVADIAVKDGYIAAVGKNIGTGKKTIDAEGLMVTPGFIDVHTHYDGHVIWDSTLSPTVWHGISTVVMGNCGVGFAPARSVDRDYLMDMMATVEDIPKESLEEGLTWEWETYPQYLQSIASRSHTVDIASMIPHAPVRTYVMGKNASQTPSTEELGRMCQIVREGIKAGAVGLSTSRTILHTTSDGVPIPGTHADEKELTALARAVREGGDGVRGLLEVSPAGITFPEPEGLLEGIQMLIRVAREARCPVVFSLVQSTFSPHDYRDVLDLIEQAQLDGVSIYAEVGTRPIAALLGFQGTFNPFARCPSYAPLLGMSLDQRIAALRDPDLRERILREEDPDPSGIALVFTADGFWDDVYPMGETLNYYPHPDDSIQKMADQSGRDPKAIAYDAMLENDGYAFLMYMISNWGSRSRKPLLDMVNSPASIIGLADGGAHSTAVVDSSQTTTFLMGWVEETNIGDTDALSLETAIHKLTLRNAEIFGLNDRGAIRSGLKADINLIDLNSLGVAHPVMLNDLPLDRPRLDQRATGYVASIVNGKVIQENGELTGEKPGRLVHIL